MGREREQNRLSELLPVSPLTVLHGPGGIGKTALALMALRRAFVNADRRAAFVSVPEGEPVHQLVRTLVGLLAQLGGGHDALDLAAIESDLDVAIETLMDLADEVDGLVLIDDLHHLEGSPSELLSALSHSAHQARFVVTTRRPPKLDWVKERAVEVGALDEASLRALGQSLLPDGEVAQLGRMAVAAQGSPWVFRQMVFEDSGRSLDAIRDASREQMLADVSSEGVRFVEVLSLLHSPVPPSLLAPLTATPSPDEWLQLEERGWLHQVGEGVCLHDVAAGLLRPADPAAFGALANEVATFLSQDLDEHTQGGVHPPHWGAFRLEAVRLWIGLGKLDAALATLASHGHALLSEGFAPRLFQTLVDVDDRRFRHWRLRCATELGNATALEAVGRPASASPEERRVAAYACYLAGDILAALQLLGDDELEEAGLEKDGTRVLAARCRYAQGDVDGALRLLGAQEVAGAFSSGSEAVHSLALMLHAVRLTETEERAAAFEQVAAAVERLFLARELLSAEALVDLAFAAFLVGRTARAQRLLDDVLATPRGGAESHHLARRALLLRARIHLRRGELGTAQALVDTVRPYVRGTSMLRPALLSIEVERRIAAGEFVGLGAVMERLAQLGGDGWVRSRWRRTAAHLHWLNGQEGATSEATDRLMKARALLSAGDLVAADGIAEEVARSAAQRGERIREAEAQLLRCEVMIIARRPNERQQCAALLADLADAMGSTRFRCGASFFEQVGDVAVLERLAAAAPVAPSTARRAQRLLGFTDGARGVDEEVAVAWAEALEGPLDTVGGTDAYQPGWGADRRGQRVWLPSGRWVDLHRKPTLWALLMFLVAEGGRASKEALVMGAWGERQYHPERHSPKLHVAVRSLRKLIEEDPSQPALLHTVDDGYTITLPFRLLGEST